MQEFVTPVEETGVRAWYHQAWRGHLAMLLGFAVVAGPILAHHGADTVRHLFTDLTAVGLSVWATIELVLTARNKSLDQKIQRAWWFLALGIGTLTFASGLFAVLMQYLEWSAPMLPAVGIFDVVAQLILLVGLLLIPTRPRTRGDLIKLCIDAAIVIVAGGTLFWDLLLLPALRTGVEVTTIAGTVVTLVNPVGDMVLLLVGAITLVARPRLGSRSAVRFIVVALFMMLAADVGYSYLVLHAGIFRSAGLSGVASAAAMVLWIAAARHQRWRASHVSADEESNEARTVSTSVIPYVAVLAGYALLFMVAQRQQVASLTAIVIAVFVLTVCVLLRQFITVRENAQLMAEQITQEARFRQELTHQAYHDPLTGLANRAWFGNQVDAALARGESSVTQLAVFFLDLDNFKNINDSLGHGVGDALLTEVAARLLNATRGSDTVARLGGDEFAVLVGRVTSEKDIAIIAERIVGAIRAPFELHGRQVYTSTSIGIARALVGQTTETLLRNADVAMYVSKRQGKGVYTIFEPGMHEAASRRLATETELRQGLTRGEFSLVFQPIVDMPTRRTIGVETLTRWHHPERGELPPADFIPLAEECGLILPLGRWVLTEACHAAARWRSMLPEDAPFTVAVNISRRQLEQATFVDDVAAVLSETELDPKHLLLEITESVIVRDTEMMRHRLSDLKALGVRLGIDDFGTGYSSLGFLQQFPIDVLKIDQSFVNGLAAERPDPSAVALAQTIVTLGQSLSLETVAEGVEGARQADTLTAMGCAVAQGFHFSKPVSPDAIDTLVLDVAKSSSGRAA